FVPGLTAPSDHNTAPSPSSPKPLGHNYTGRSARYIRTGKVRTRCAVFENPLARGCHPCLGYVLLPMCPGRIRTVLAEREPSKPCCTIPPGTKAGNLFTTAIVIAARNVDVNCFTLAAVDVRKHSERLNV